MTERSSSVLGTAPGTCPQSLGAAEALHELAEPWVGGERVKRAIERAAKRAGLSYWRAFDIWYGKARQIQQFELDAIADALGQKRKEDQRNEAHELRLRITRLESLLAQADADFYRPQITALRDQRRGMDRGGGAQHRALAATKPA